MAKFKADIKFRGKKEKKIFEQNEEFEMTVERANEIESTIKKDHPEIKSVMTRLDEPETNPEKTKSPKKE